MGPLTIVLLGEPVAFARSGHNSKQHFTPARQRTVGAALRIAAQQEMLHRGAAVLDEPLRIELLAEFAIPSTWSKLKQQAAIRQEIHPAKRPDIDNLYKLAADALNMVVYRDDALIVEARLRKVYGLQPKIVLTITPIAHAIAQKAA